ncbi:MULTISPECIES: DUF6554 family protein [Prochlorococcus]|uniref:DUF6554 family protein n=1 Tax=Prochlorococcus TaxID=1218 RepID=UPI000533A278|nr:MULTISPECIES: DUF6554 family protein [Prochlorococcus]KGG13359.1 putative Bacterial type II secretion system pr [Prochlorococcus sp. MIT 0601]
MLKKRNLVFIPFAIGFLTSIGFFGSTAALAGAGIGVDIYCLMREGGNSHESSWRAAYESIKNQKPGIFKTSPRQAAAMIIESVVREPAKYNNCVGYLGDLYPNELEIQKQIQAEVEAEVEAEEQDEDDKGYIEERYSY